MIQADGGTRVSSITGSFIALYDAIAWMISQKMITENPIRYFAAAVSVGVVDDIPLLDLCYTEDSSAMVDMNVVMTEEGSFIEIQATGEERPISEIEMDQLMLLATNGIMKIIQVQKETLGLDL